MSLEGRSRRGMWRPYWGANASKEDPPLWILLAHRKPGCRGLRKKMRQVSKHANTHHQPAANLKYLTSPWPFAQWGIDLLGPFPTATGQRRFLVVAVDYFTKWVEAEPLTTITTRNVQNFVLKNIVCHFGLPRVLNLCHLHSYLSLCILYSSLRVLT